MNSIYFTLSKSQTLWLLTSKSPICIGFPCFLYPFSSFYTLATHISLQFLNHKTKEILHTQDIYSVVPSQNPFSLDLYRTASSPQAHPFAFWERTSISLFKSVPQIYSISLWFQHQLPNSMFYFGRYYILLWQVPST